MSLSWIYHNTHDLKCREPFGAVPSGEKVTLRLGLQATTKIETGFYVYGGTRIGCRMPNCI